ncbi:MAG: alanine racemase [Flavobacteriales bacterium]|nr:alanine racemase [Flavobacteriales bacterium]
MVHTSTIEISQSALKANVGFIKDLLGDGCELSSVVKGNAYGHGIGQFVPLAEECGVRHFSVFSAQEAFQAKEVLSSNSEVMIMGMIDKADIEWAVRNHISFFVFDITRLENALEVAKRIKIPARIHIELDTGLNRTGYTKKQLRTVVEFLTKHAKYFIVEGLCTHYAGAESIANHVRVSQQYKLFNKYKRWLSEKGIEPIRLHTACSAAAISYPKTRMDMARIGIMQYGYWPSRETHINFIGGKREKEDPLKQVITWKSRVMTTHLVHAGEFVGYGTSYMAEQDMKVAVVPVGYAQGYSRSLSNTGRILIRGARVSVIGVVNMNMLIADVSNVPETSIGDEVVLIGRQGDMGISVSSFGELSAQLNYELLTRLPHDIPRIITP